MDDHKIIAAYCIIDETLSQLGHRSHYHAQVSDAEVLTLAVVAAMYFHNHHERTLCVMYGMRYISKPLSTSRFSRRLHALAHLLEFVVEVVGELFAGEEVFIIDSMPAPVCKYVRAFRCRKIPAAPAEGRHYFGWCAAKKEKFYGWRLHLISTPAGVPVRFMLLPAAWHDLTPIYELTYGLAKGAKLYGDKGYISALVKRQLRPTYSREQRDGLWLIAKHKKNMAPNSYEERVGLAEYRHSIETRNSQLENMGVQRLHARTNAGFALKMLASLLALACINLY
jgi:hypothetical protein